MRNRIVSGSSTTADDLASGILSTTLAKLKFTLSGFGHLIRERYTLTEADGNRFEIAFSDPAEQLDKVTEINEDFLEHLGKNSEFKDLVVGEPHWRERILFAEAIHYLADINFRLHIDRSPRAALYCYLVGGSPFKVTKTRQIGGSHI